MSLREGTAVAADRLVRAPAALWRAGEFGVVVLAPGADEVVTLAGTGARLWDALAEARRPDELVSALAHAHGADPGVVARDLEPALDHLITIGAVVWARGRSDEVHAVRAASPPPVATRPAPAGEGGLGRWCGVGLPGAAPTPVGPLDAAAWDELARGAWRERAVPLLAVAARQGTLRLTAEQAAELTEAHEDVMRACLILEARAVAVGAALDRAGIDFRLLKGAAVARLDYPDPSWRAFGDVDVLVPAAAYDAAVAILEGLGGHRRYREVRPGFDRRFGKGVCIVLPDGCQVDVHRSFVAGPFGLTIDLDALFATPATVRIGAVDLPVLTREHRFLHACYHAALGDRVPRLVALRDVAQLLAAPDLDLDHAREEAGAWRAEAVVARAVDAAWHTLELAPDAASTWAAGYEPDRFEARSLVAYAGAERSYARQMAAGLHAVRGWPEKAAYLRALLMVPPEYARRHDGGYARRLYRAWQAHRGGRVA